ncbi:MAG: hypothetical protein DYG85_06375 [Chloroflexi bacterium CFX1]|nr:hypothetical protein Rctr41k_25 [Virus Rctr41k]MCE7919130.1 hypothetical protein [Chloroflexi bacterium CFX1]
MFEQFIGLAAEYGWQGMLFALVVLVLVYVARINGLVVNGNWARVANVVLAAILTGLNPLESDAEKAIVAVIASLGSALLYEFIQFATKKLAEAKKQ